MDSRFPKGGSLVRGYHVDEMDFIFHQHGHGNINCADVRKKVEDGKGEEGARVRS